VREVVAAFQGGRFEEAVAAFDPDVVYEVMPSTGPEPGVFHGHDGLRRAFRQWMDFWEEYETGVDEVSRVGDYVLAVGWDRGKAAATGITVERPDVAFVYSLTGGRIVRAWMFATKPEALAAIQSRG
jgi:ketosteroid isomerase-like protein